MKVSILMPTFNTRPSYLRSAIRGILGQTYPDTHLIIADDASNATTIAVIENAIKGHEDKASLYKRSENGGTARALDTALAHADADTDLFACAASDDIYHRTWIDRRVAYMESLPSQVAIVYEDYMLLSDYVYNLQTWGPYMDPRSGEPIMRPQAIPIRLPDYDYRLLLTGNYIPGVSMWRASVYDKIPRTFVYDGYDEIAGRHAEDYNLWLNITDHWDAYHILCDPALSWTYRVKAQTGKHTIDRGGVARARRLLVKRAVERRGL